MANVLTVVAKIRAAKGKGDALAALLAEQAGVVRKAEPGCLVYRPHRSTKDPDLFIFYEMYKDEAAFDVHRKGPAPRRLPRATGKGRIDRGTARGRDLPLTYRVARRAPRRVCPPQSAPRFADEGAHVFITGRRQAELDQAVKQIAHGAVGVQGDVAKMADLDRLYATVKEQRGRIDVLFANAGGGDFAALGAITEAHFDL